MRVVFFILFTASVFLGVAQTNYYVSEYAGNGAEENCSLTSLGNFIYSTGFTSTFGNGQSDGLLNKYKLDGTLLWSKAYGGAKNESFKKIKQLHDGNLLMVGLTNSFSNFTNNDSNIFVVKTDTSGSIIWTKTFGGPQLETACDFTEDADSSVLVLGNTTSIGAGQTDIMLLKLDKAGNYIWSKSQGDISNDIPTSILDVSGGYVISGRTNSFGLNGYYPFVLRVNSIGDYLWGKTYEKSNSGPPNTTAYRIIKGYFNDYLMVGRFGNGSVNDAQHFAMDIDTTGGFIWGNYYVFNSGDGGAFSVIKTSDGNFLLSGDMGNYYPMAVKINPLGQLVFNTIYSNSGGSFSLAGYITECCEVAGTYIHAGYSFASGDTKSLLIKTDFSGNAGTCVYQPGFNTASIFQPTINSRTFSKTTTNYTLLDTCLVMSGSLIRTTYCNAVETDIFSAGTKFKLFPNPSNTTVNISADMLITRIKINNVLGKEVSNIVPDKTSFEYPLEISNLEDGIYFITITSGKESCTQKLLIQH